jgi:hypothetical protein
MCNTIGVPDAQLMKGLFAAARPSPPPGPGERKMLTVATRDAPPSPPAASKGL